MGQVLLHDTSFNLGRFLIEIVCWTFIIEASGAVLLWFMAPNAFSPFSAVFHAVSAFCNAGFSLFAGSLTAWKGHWGINLVLMVLIVTGGIGFLVFLEVKNAFMHRITNGKLSQGKGVSWYARVVVRTSLFLILFGWIALYSAEFVGYNQKMTLNDAMLSALFQSVTARTAGFNTLHIGQLTNVSLVILLFLMFVGWRIGVLCRRDKSHYVSSFVGSHRFPVQG